MLYFQNHYERAFGTFPLRGDALKEALNTALDIGYRAIDTAQFYANEADIGHVIKQSNLARSELFLTSKVPIDKYAQSTFIPSVLKSLEDLQIDKLDVLLLHWPPVDGDIEQPLTWLQEAQSLGLTQYIGVSNFTAAMLKRTLSLTDVPIVTNQVEFHPLLDQTALLDAASETGIPLASYCSVARGAVFKQPIFDELSRAYGVTPAQIVLRWILQKGVSINTMSTKTKNIKANFDVLSFTLSHVDMKRIDKLTHTNYRIVDKHLVPWAPAWD